MSSVEIVEVGPRDGVQSVPTIIPTEEKLRLINGLLDAGVKRMEIGSFVSPKAIPQMQDVAEIIRTQRHAHPQHDYAQQRHDRPSKRRQDVREQVGKNGYNDSTDWE